MTKKTSINMSASVKTDHPKSRAMPATKATKAPKSQIVVKLLSHVYGASLDDLCKATGWQQHSARAFMTGLKKKGYEIGSEKVEGIRRYRAAPPSSATTDAAA